MIKPCNPENPVDWHSVLREKYRRYKYCILHLEAIMQRKRIIKFSVAVDRDASKGANL